MKKLFILATFCVAVLISNTISAQIDEDAIGAWYMYFYNTTICKSKWGIQGDIQHRNWNAIGDLEQLMLRSGLTYQPKDAKIKFTLGFANVTTGRYGDDKTTVNENRIYQEALFPVNFGNRVYTNHRFRYEQRFVENQNLRTRYRYNLFLNIALNKPTMEKNTVYLALYNELFINGQRNIGIGNTLEIFDRNRLYAALGYVISKGLKVQFGTMRQSTDNWSKNQLQFSLHHTFNILQKSKKSSL